MREKTRKPISFILSSLPFLLLGVLSFTPAYGGPETLGPSPQEQMRSLDAGRGNAHFVEETGADDAELVVVTTDERALPIIMKGQVSSTEEKAIPLRFFVPAFKVRDLGVLNRLSTSFTRMQPRFRSRELLEEVLCTGGVLDRNEAADFAHLALVSIAPKGNPKLVERVARSELCLSPGELIFFPFQEQLHSLREDFLGTAIHLNTLR